MDENINMKKRINQILKRDVIIEQIKKNINEFNSNVNEITMKRGFFIYGDPGCGKTTLINDILNELDYDTVSYNASDIRNKNIIDVFKSENMASNNVLSLFHKKKRNIAIIMDEIDGMNSGDKGGITSLIKLVRPKKTKKQKLENYSSNLIFCIGNYHMDKKIKELMKVSNVYEIKNPTQENMEIIIKEFFKNISDNELKIALNIIDSDLMKLNYFYKSYLSNNKIFQQVEKYIVNKSYNEDVKNTTKYLYNNNLDFEEHLSFINETDRTIISLLWHENIVDLLSKYNSDTKDFYLNILENYCFADYLDRITFQKQIWQFNEMTSIIKIMFNNFLYHKKFKKKIKYNPSEVRFTKVLTKYSTEFNNYTFIVGLCQNLNMDFKDLLTFFYELKNLNKSEEELNYIFENQNISKLDINRIYRYIEKFTNYDLNEE
tara:strand:+ start:6775 stop:8073 length:1299 start_codon:yes stop_codon:yes gene_type:complete